MDVWTDGQASHFGSRPWLKLFCTEAPAFGQLPRSTCLWPSMSWNAPGHYIATEATKVYSGDKNAWGFNVVRTEPPGTIFKVTETTYWVWAGGYYGTIGNGMENIYMDKTLRPYVQHEHVQPSASTSSSGYRAAQSPSRAPPNKLDIDLDLFGARATISRQDATNVQAEIRHLAQNEWCGEPFGKLEQFLFQTL